MRGLVVLAVAHAHGTDGPVVEVGVRVDVHAGCRRSTGPPASRSAATNTPTLGRCCTPASRSSVTPRRPGLAVHRPRAGQPQPHRHPEHPARQARRQEPRAQLRAHRCRRPQPGRLRRDPRRRDRRARRETPDDLHIGTGGASHWLGSFPLEPSGGRAVLMRPHHRGVHRHRPVQLPGGVGPARSRVSTRAQVPSRLKRACRFHTGGALVAVQGRRRVGPNEAGEGGLRAGCGGRSRAGPGSPREAAAGGADQLAAATRRPTKGKVGLLTEPLTHPLAPGGSRWHGHAHAVGPPAQLAPGRHAAARPCCGYGSRGCRFESCRAHREGPGQGSSRSP